jgi:LAGLIDADG endonuclease
LVFGASGPKETIKFMKIKDLYWAAGFLDGEGCFSLHQNKYAQIDVPQKDSQLLYKLKNMFGGEVYRRKNGQIFVWSIYGNYAIGLMMTLYTVMSDKRKIEIGNVISIWKTLKIMSNSSKFRTHCGKGLHKWEKSNIYRYVGSNNVTKQVCWPCKKEYAVMYQKNNKSTVIGAN